MEGTRGDLYLLLWLDDLLTFDLYDYEKNRRKEHVRKEEEEARDGSLSMLMTTDKDRLQQTKKMAYGRQ